MTLKDKVAEMDPDYVDEDYLGGVYGCPDAEHYDYLNAQAPVFCSYYNRCRMEELCTRCWNREYIPRRKDEYSNL